MNLDLIGPLKKAAEDIYTSKGFPMVFLGGSIVLEYFTSDVAWVLVGIGGFLFFTFWKRDR